MQLLRAFTFQLLLLTAFLGTAPDGLQAQVTSVDSLLHNFRSVINHILGCPEDTTSVGGTILLNRRIPAGPFPIRPDTAVFSYGALVTSAGSSNETGSSAKAEGNLFCNKRFDFLFDANSLVLQLVCGSNSREYPAHSLDQAMAKIRSLLNTGVTLSGRSYFRHPLEPITPADMDSLANLRLLADSCWSKVKWPIEMAFPARIQVVPDSAIRLVWIVVHPEIRSDDQEVLEYGLFEGATCAPIQITVVAVGFDVGKMGDPDQISPKR